jgi:hypothetical protein
MKYNIGDIVVVKREGYQIYYAYVNQVYTDNLGMNWYTFKYQVPQRFGGITVDCETLNEIDLLLHIDKVP